MGANAVTTVPVYTAGEVLTAEDMNITNSGIPVFATTTTRDAAFGGAGEKTLAQGQTCYIEATSTYQTYNGSAWVSLVTAPGLVLVKTQTIGSAVSSVAVSDAFSATYNNYKITVTGGVGSVNSFFSMTLTGSTANYNNKLIYGSPGDGSVSGAGNNAASSWQFVGSNNPNGQTMNVEIFSPFLAAFTTFTASIAENNYSSGSAYGTNAGIHGVATSYTGFTLAPQSGTATGGTIRVYGYANS
jgi:hypothetical protein